MTSIAPGKASPTRGFRGLSGTQGIVSGLGPGTRVDGRFCPTGGFRSARKGMARWVRRKSEDLPREEAAAEVEAKASKLRRRHTLSAHEEKLLAHAGRRMLTDVYEPRAHRDYLADPAGPKFDKDPGGAFADLRRDMRDRVEAAMGVVRASTSSEVACPPGLSPSAALQPRSLG